MLADALGMTDAERAALLVAARAPLVDSEAASSPSLGLPEPPTRLVGRDPELAELRGLFAAAGVRLLTLTGPGGSGKTRLAIALAKDVGDRFPDGAVFVDLAPIADPQLVVPAIAVALRVRETMGEPLLETLTRYLRKRRLLLVLDNCEQVLASASDIATLLAACPNLAILATSREPLHIRAEHEIDVAPLLLPAPGRLPPLAELADVPAVALFVERAESASAGFSLTAGNAAAVAGICQRLDGLPLAIELAAARIKVLPPAALLARLELRLPLLTGGNRDAPLRQRTMRDAIAWSYDLLAAEEQGVFRRLAVFAGGCTLEAAEAVAGQDGTADVFASIAALIESSLLRQEEDRAGEPRFRMLETVREYGREQLTLAGEQEAVRQGHAEFFRRLVETQARGTPLLVILQSLAPLIADQDNLRLALAWFDERAESDTLMHVSTALYGLWLMQGLYREGLHWIERAQERSAHIASGPRLEALVVASRLAAFQGDYTRAAAFSAEGLALACALGDPLRTAKALEAAGLVSYRRGDYGQAKDHLEEALRVLRGLSETVPDAISELATNLMLLGDTALVQKQFDRAATRYAEACEVAQTVADAYAAIDAQTGLAAANYCTGNTARAASLYMDSLDRVQNVGPTLLVASALFGLAGVAAESGHSEEGAHLLGVAEGSAASVGAPIFPRDQPVRDRALAALTATLDEQRLAAAREAGRALTLKEAIGEAQAVAERVMRSPP